MKVLIIFIAVFTLITVSSCCSCSNKSKEDKLVTIEHFNISIVPDLSNRIDNIKNPKPIEDIEIVEQIIDDIYPNILKNRIDTDQPDKIRMIFTNPKVISLYDIDNSVLEFDFSKFNSQTSRIDYLLNRDKKSSFKKDKDSFINEFSKTINKARSKTYGADLWSFFSDINNTAVISKQDTVAGKGVKYIHKYKNLIILITDGYIEAGLYGKRNSKGNKSYYLSSKTISDFRNRYNKSGEKEIKTFFDKEGYGIVPIKNEFLKDLEVMAVEFYDRSLSKSGNATVRPKDADIINLFWDDWMKKSGVKRFECCKIASTPEEFLKSFHDFAKIRVNN